MRRTFSFLALLLVLLAIMATPSLGARENASLQRDSKAMSLLEKMAVFLSQTQRFSVDIRSGYDVVQKSGQKIEFGEVRQVRSAVPTTCASRSNGAMEKRAWSSSMVKI